MSTSLRKQRVKIGDVYSCPDLREYIVILDEIYYSKWDVTTCNVLYLLSGKLSNIRATYIIHSCKLLT